MIYTLLCLKAPFIKFKDRKKIIVQKWNISSWIQSWFTRLSISKGYVALKKSKKHNFPPRRISSISKHAWEDLNSGGSIVDTVITG